VSRSLGGLWSHWWASLVGVSDGKEPRFISRDSLTPGQRKSVEPMAARLHVDYQKLQQFITDSPWDDGHVCNKSDDTIQQGGDNVHMGDYGSPGAGIGPEARAGWHCHP